MVFCNGGDLPVVEPPPLPLYIASRLVKCAVLENMDCPISLEPISTQTLVWVGSCGHVCGSAFSAMLKGQYPLKECPMCRKEETWRPLYR